MDEADDPIAEEVALELGDVLDLHHFRPRDVPELVRDYLDDSLERGYDQVRIIHGKGIGNLRRTVHAILGRHPGVAEFSLAGEGGGGWGATIVVLHPRADA
ncbi:MAG: Smr/MutS family protein [Myxococcota bacterium]